MTTFPASYDTIQTPPKESRRSIRGGLAPRSTFGSDRQVVTVNHYNLIRPKRSRNKLEVPDPYRIRPRRVRTPPAPMTALPFLFDVDITIKAVAGASQYQYRSWYQSSHTGAGGYGTLLLLPRSYSPPFPSCRRLRGVPLPIGVIITINAIIVFLNVPQFCIERF